MASPRVETIERRIKAAEAAGYVVRCIRADGSLEVDKRDAEQQREPDLSLIDMSKR